jgi:hypothetical protein
LEFQKQEKSKEEMVDFLLNDDKKINLLSFFNILTFVLSPNDIIRGNFSQVSYSQSNLGSSLSFSSLSPLQSFNIFPSLSKYLNQNQDYYDGSSTATKVSLPITLT